MTTPSRRRTLATETRATLSARYPATFKGKGKHKFPLKVGIYHDLRATNPDITAAHLGAALADYTAGPTYLRSMVEGAARIDLSGLPHGVVTADDALDAYKKLLGRPVHK